MQLMPQQNTIRETREDVVIADLAEAYSLSLRDLRAFSRLHLPAFRHRLAAGEFSNVDEYLSWLASEAADTVAPFRTWLNIAVASGTPNVNSLRMRPLNEKDAAIVFGRFHYLHSIRDYERAWGFYSGELLVAAVELSKFDLPHIRPLPLDISSDEITVVSRVYAFPCAPHNTLSFVFSRIAASETERGKRALLTYVNPNLGFTGVSYRAANWTLFGHEHGTRYQYLDGRYVTDRLLTSMFGTSAPVKLGQMLHGRHICVSEGLKPLLLFGYLLGDRKRWHSTDLWPIDVERPR